MTTGLAVFERAQGGQVEVIDVGVREQDEVDFGQVPRCSAGATMRFRPRVKGPRSQADARLKTGSVRMVKPSIFSSTVEWPSQAAWRPRSGQAGEVGTMGRGAIGWPSSRANWRQNIGAAL